MTLMLRSASNAMVPERCNMRNLRILLIAYAVWIIVVYGLAYLTKGGG